jgi:c-di-GMP-binding flagellar brake protein YcgR
MVTLANNAVQERIDRFISTYYATPEFDREFETRRKHTRFPMAETMDIMLDSTQTPAEVILTTGRDISEGGIGFYSHRPIPAGTEMVINIDNGKDRLITKAVAVHNTMSVGLFKIGAKFIF